MSINTSSERAEQVTLEQFAVRWGVLNAWLGDLRDRGAPIRPEVVRQLNWSRAKLTTGVYSSCEVGCELGTVEAALVSAAASVDPDGVDGWLDLAGRAMTDPRAVRDLPRFQSITPGWLDCGPRGCDCPAW